MSQSDLSHTRAESRVPSRLVRPARFVYLLGLALALLVPSPVDWISVPLLKISLFCVCLTVSLILCMLGGGFHHVLRAKGKIGAALVALLPLAYLLSFWYSANRSIGLFGIGAEVDTVFFMLIAALTLFAGFVLFRSVRSARTFFKMILCVLAVAVAFQYISILLGAHILPSVFSDKSVNLIGKWNDFGLLAALAAILVLMRLELGDDDGWRYWLWIVALALLAAMIAIVNFSLLWEFLIAGGLVVGAMKFFGSRHARRLSGDVARPGRPWIAGIVIIVSILFFVWGNTIAAHLPSIFTVPALEVRPAMSTDYQIAQSSHAGIPGRVLLGDGPNTFAQEWLINKPISVNQTEFWNVGFVNGFSLLSTAFLSVGLLGTLAWLLPFLLVLIALWRIRHMLPHLPMSERLMLIGLSLSGLFVWVGFAFYTSSQDVVLLGFALVGVLWGVASGHGSNASVPISQNAEENRSSKLREIVTLVLAVILVALAAWPTLVFGRQFTSYIYEGRAADAFSAQDLQGASSLITTSQKIAKTSDNLELGVQISLAQLEQLAGASTTPATINAMRQQFQSILSSAIAQGQAAATLNPHDPNAYLGLGNVYEFLVPFNVQGAYESAQNAYQAAEILDPKNPTIPLLLARVAATADLKDNLTSIENLVQQSLTLKSNYTDAFLFAEQLAVQENDLPTATRAAYAAAQSDPTDPSMWFQLGLDLYTGNDFKDAVTSLQQAVALEPDYANAQYFLGLSYDKTGDTQDALAQFEALSQSNPGNTEVETILSNLQAGKNPFAGDATTTPPQKRETAPVKE